MISDDHRTGNMDEGDMVAKASDQRQVQRVIAIRDSKDPDGPKLFLSVSAWEDLLERIKAGELELPEDMRQTLDERFR
jgi:Domain of unknown function (DUF397)